MTMIMSMTMNDLHNYFVTMLRVMSIIYVAMIIVALMIVVVTLIGYVVDCVDHRKDRTSLDSQHSNIQEKGGNEHDRDGS